MLPKNCHICAEPVDNRPAKIVGIAQVCLSLLSLLVFLVFSFFVVVATVCRVLAVIDVHVDVDVLVLCALQVFPQPVLMITC
jgi:hypothetical protein